MEEGGFSTEPARIRPDQGSALFALETAMGMLQSARTRFTQGNFAGAFEESRNAIRMASSALLYRDGFVSESLDSTLQYLSRAYPAQFPLEQWQRFEEIPLEDTPGLYNMLLAAMGKIKKAGRQEAVEAISAAAVFIETAEEELGI